VKEESPSKQLKKYGVSRGLAVRRRPWLYVAIIVFAALGFGLLRERTRNPSDSLDGTKVATAVLAMGALVLGYQQWRSSRFETSIDKLFERLEASNKKLREGKTVRFLLDTEDDPETYEQSLYVFSEIDNLEYVMQKYKWLYEC
jgi:hypothetical protein